MRTITGGCAAALCLLAALYLTVGFEGALVFICTDLMYARGWMCFVPWVTAAILSRPMQVSHEASPYPQLHGAAWTLSWLWWATAVLVADLHSRDDLLFFAYLATGTFIAAWRNFLHAFVLQFFARRALRHDSYAPGVIELAGGPVGDRGATPQSVWDRCLHAIARFREAPSVNAFDRALFGSRRPSALLLVEAMANTDARCLELRRAIRAFEDFDAALREASPAGEAERQAARDAARAFRCEAEIWLTARRACAEQQTGESIQRRALAVFSLLALCLTRGSMQSEHDFAAAVRALADDESFPGLVADILCDEGTRAIDHFEQLVDAKDSLSSVSLCARILGSLSIASTLARLFLFRQALSLLENERRSWRLEMEREGTDDRVQELEQTVDALIGEIERSSIQRAGSTTTEHPRSPQDEMVIVVREARQRAAMREGRHPSTGVRVTPSDFARLPQPLHPREAGAGVGVACVATAVTAVVVGVIWWYPLTARTQTVFKVPFGGEIASTGIKTATVAQTDGVPTLLLADPVNGVRTLAIETLRTASEGGRGTALDGTVRKIAANPDGTVLAIFDAAENGSPCLSVRDRSGSWKALIAPSALSVNGDEIEAALFGLAEPLLLRKSGDERLMQYSEQNRTLLDAKTEQSYTIEGHFVDCAEGLSDEGTRRIVLLTKLEGSSVCRLYEISQPSDSAPLRVKQLESPSLKARTAVAVCIESERRLVLLDSGGGAWRSPRSDPARKTDWQRIRAGAQGLELDRIDLAVVAEDGGRLWFIRDGEVWTRPLVESTSMDEYDAGWSRSTLPLQALSTPKDRWQIVESAGPNKSIFLLAPTDRSMQSSGSLLQVEPTSRDKVSDGEDHEVLRITEHLRNGETLLDGDGLASHGVVAILETVPGNAPERSVRLDVVGDGLRTIYRTPVLDSTFSFGGLLAAGSANGDAFAVATSGEFVRFDPTRDNLKPVDSAGKSHIGKLALPAQALDASIGASSDAPFVDVLAQSGSVYRSTLRAGEPMVQIVDAASGPPASMLSPRFVVTDSDGATIFGEGDVWRYSLKDAGNPFAQRQSELGLRPASMILTKSPTSGAAIAWLANDGRELRSLSAGAFAKTSLPLSLTSIRPGFPDSLFALDVDGALRFASLQGESRVLLPPQRNGPDAVLASALREGFVDYLDRDSLHAIRRSDGAWSSFELDGDYELHSLDGATQGTLLLPLIAGTPKLFPDNREASGGFALDKRGPMKAQQILGEGVIGLGQADELLGWVPFDNGAPIILPDRRQRGLALETTVDAIPSGDGLFLLGSSDGVGKPDRLIRYAISGQSKLAQELPPELRSMEIGSRALYVLSPSKVHELDPNTLQLRVEFPTPPAEQVVLGEMDAGARNMSIVSSAGVHRIDATGLSCLLQSPSEGTDPVPAFASVALSGDQVVIFTPDGAWQRPAEAESPFTRVPHLKRGARLVTLAPDGGAWGCVGDEWVCTRTGTVASRGIGWTSRGEQVQALNGIPSVGGNPIRGFEPAPVSIGTPIGVEPLSPQLTLLIGTRGAVLFDTWSRTFEAPADQLRGLKQGVRIFDRDGLSSLALDTDGRVTTVAQTPDWRFGGLKVDQLLVAPVLLARTTDGAVVDDRGVEVQNLPPKDSGQTVGVRSAALVASELYRVLDDRSVDVVDVSSFTHRRLPWSADSVATAGGRIVALSDQPRRVEMPGLRKEWLVDGWFVGPDMVAFWEDDAISVLSASLSPLQRNAAEPLPGEVVGNLPNSTSALVRRSSGEYSLFDLLYGRTLVDTLPGQNPFIKGDAIWCLSDDGGQVSAVLANGRIIPSSNFNSVCVVSTDQGIEPYALRITSREASLVQLDGASLAPGKTKERWTSRYPALVSTLSSPLTVVQLKKGMQLIIGRESVALDDGERVQAAANPLGTSQPSLEFDSGRLIGEGVDGRRVILLKVSSDGFRLDARTEPQPRPTTGGGYTPFRLLRWSVHGKTAPPLLKLSEGTLDTTTGWLIEEQPIRLLDTPAGMSIEFRSGALQTVVPSAAMTPHAERAWQHPLRLEQGSLVFDRASGSIELGPPIPGARLAAHQVKVAAPISAPDRAATGMAWIDRLGQLWTSDGVTTICVSTGKALTSFKVDPQTAIYATGSEVLVLVPWHGEKLRDALRVHSQLLDDCQSIEGRANWIAWEPRKKGEPLKWSIVLADRTRAPIKPTTQGFDVVSGRMLGLSEGNPCIVLPSETLRLSVPIVRQIDGASSIDWTSPPSTVASQPVPSGRAPQNRVSSSGISELAIENGMAWIELNGGRFAFEPDKNRFEFNQCQAASSSDGRLVTLLDGGGLLVWQRRSDGSWGSPQRIDCPAAPSGALWSSDGALMIEAKEGQGQYWRLSGGTWQKAVPPSIVRSADARWDWDGSVLKLAPEGETYRFVKNRWPRLDFEDVDMSARPRIDEANRVAYRSRSGAWFQLDGGMPKRLASPPEPRATSMRFEQLLIERPTAENNAVRAKLGDVEIRLRIKDGLIPDIDDWNEHGAIVPVGANRALIKVGSRGDSTAVYRPVELRAGALRLLPPLDAPKLQGELERAIPRFVRTELANLSLDADYALRVGPTSLGVPGPSGFPQLDPSRVIPILFDSSGELRLAFNNALYSSSVGSLVDSFRQTSPTKSITGTAWIQSPSGLQFIATSAADGPFTLDVANSLQPLERTIKPSDFADIRGSDRNDSFESTSTSQRISLKRLVPQPLEVHLIRGSGDRAVIEHTQASRIVSDGDGFTTQSGKWSARYRVINGKATLYSTQARDLAGWSPMSIAFGATLVARQREDSNRWSIGPASEATGALWPFGALSQPPSRVYADAGNGVLEAGNGWVRRRADDGSIVARTLSSSPPAFASTEARRRGERIFAAGRLYSTGDGEPVRGAEAVRLAGALDWSSGGPWGVRLERSSATLQIRYQGAPIEPRTGALPLDFAVAAGSAGAESWLIDRMSVARLRANALNRFTHEESVRTALMTTEPRRMHGREIEGKTVRALRWTDGSASFDLLMPQSDASGIRRIEANTSLESWTVGSKLAVRLRDDGLTEFLRADARGGWVRYPTVARADSCRTGRFPFDNPVDLFLASRPGFAGPQGCVAMQSGWEWPITGDRSTPEVMFSAPTTIAPEFGPQLNPTWLASSDLDASAVASVTPRSGVPIIWYPSGGRLFVVGERSVLWVETGTRWRGRPVIDD
jgi:hypothetical protein